MNVPTKSLNNMREDMNPPKKLDKWLQPEEYRKQQRLLYLKTFMKPIPEYCPECGDSLIHDETETYCQHCGLLTSSNIEYVAGIHIIFDYGRH